MVRIQFNFHSQPELTIPSAHQDLYRADILHRDISVNNILIDISSGVIDDEKPRRGLLIDLDMSKDLRETSSNRKHTRPQRAVRLHSMTSFVALNGISEGHTAIHVFGPITLP